LVITAGSTAPVVVVVTPMLLVLGSRCTAANVAGQLVLQIFTPEVNIRVDLPLYYPILLITGVLDLGLALPRER
jgi:hypothetical protein